MSTEHPFIGIGSEVTWCHGYAKGRSFVFTTKRGKVVDSHEGKFAVRDRSGRVRWVDSTELRLQGQITALTEAFIGGNSQTKGQP